MVAAWIILAAMAGLGLGLVVGFLWAERRCAGSSARLDAAQQQLSEREAQVERERGEAEALRQRLAEAQLRAERLQTQYEEGKQNLAEQKRLLCDAEARLRDAFAG